MATSKKLEIVYQNGRPNGIRSIRRHLSTVTTYFSSGTMLEETKSTARQ